MTLQNKLKIVEIELNPEEALTDYLKYKDHHLQPVGYNVFVHNPPLNPENRVRVAEDGSEEKVLLQANTEPLEWNLKDYGKKWKWSTDDVWAWVYDENNNKMYHVTLTTVKHQTQKLNKIIQYFDNLLQKGENVYENSTFSKYLPKGKDFREQYVEEKENIQNKLDQLGAGYLLRDKEEDFIIHAFLPEEYLSNEVLEKWRGTLLDFANTILTCLNFSHGKVV